MPSNAALKQNGNTTKELHDSDIRVIESLLDAVEALETAGITNLSQARVFLEVCRSEGITLTDLAGDAVGSTRYRRVQSNIRTLAVRKMSGTVHVPLLRYPEDKRSSRKRIDLSEAGRIIRDKVIETVRGRVEKQTLTEA